MKILLFTFYNKLEVEVHPGVGILSTVLKKAGHETRLYPYFYFNEDDLIKELEQYKPDIIGISATSMSEFQVKKICEFIRPKTKAKILIGGIFAILEPEKALNIEGVDAICIGEGTKGFLEYINGKHPATNYIYKDNTKGVFENWSSTALSKIDYTLFWDSALEKRLSISKKLDYWTCYTCEYGCAFCCSKHIRKVTGLKNKPRPSVSCTLNEIEELIKNHPYKKVHIRDPLLIGMQDIEWVTEFLHQYKSQIGLPYTCNIRADRFDEQIAELLKNTGCSQIKMGLESGSEYLRNRILLKGESDENFRQTFRLMKEYELNISLNAMLGIPYETIDTAKQTVSMLKELSFEKSFLHIYQPWPGLNLKEEVMKYIRFIKTPAIDDVITRGHLIKESLDESQFDFEKIKNEFIYTPVLDQPQFPYELALEIQKEFIGNGD